MNLLIHCWRYNCKKLVRKKSAREVVAVQVRVDSVDVRVSWSSRLIVVATVWLLGAGYMAQGARADPLKLPDTQLEPVEWTDLILIYSGYINSGAEKMRYRYSLGHHQAQC